jgi:hypothetical protein
VATIVVGMATWKAINSLWSTREPSIQARIDQAFRAEWCHLGIFGDDCVTIVWHFLPPLYFLNFFNAWWGCCLPPLLRVSSPKSLLSSEVATPHLHGATSLRKLLGDYVLFFIHRWKKQKNWGKKKSCTFGLKVGLLTTTSLLFLWKNGARNLLETLMTIKAQFLLLGTSSMVHH